MKPSMNVRDVRRVRLGVASVAALALLVALPGSAQAAAVPVPLGTAASFVVLAGAGVTNTGPTTLHGDLGTFPTTTITGPRAPIVTGTNHHGDAVTQRAKTDLVTAYNVAAGEGPTSPISGDLTGKTLTRGVYNSASSIGLTGRLTLSGSGPFVFQAGSTLTTGSGSQINLINGARSCNVFWQIGSSATLGTGSRFVGTIMAMTSITATTGANVVGRLLARNGAVTLDTNVITRPTPCAATGATGGTGTGSQVGQVPTGGVSSGDGSTAVGGDRAQGLLGGGLLLAGLGGAVVVAARRRRLNT
jgi:Ice-binding-like